MNCIPAQIPWTSDGDSQKLHCRHNSNLAPQHLEYYMKESFIKNNSSKLDIKIEFIFGTYSSFKYLLNPGLSPGPSQINYCLGD